MADPASSPPSVSSHSPEVGDEMPRISQEDRGKFLDKLPDLLYRYHGVEIATLLNDYANRRTEMLDFELRMLELIRQHKLAVMSFKKLLPTANMIPTPGAAMDPDETVFVRTGDFMDRVRAGLYDNSTSYIDWLRHVSAYNNGTMSYDEFKFKVAALFIDLPDLWKEFRTNLDKTKTDQTDEEGSTSTEAEVSSSTQPAEVSSSTQPAEVSSSTQPSPKKRRTESK